MKRYFSLLLACVLMAVLTGCNGEQAAGEPSSAEMADPPSRSSEAETPSSEPEPANPAPEEAEDSSKTPPDTAGSDTVAETRSLRVRIVDENGNSASNIEVSVYSGLTAAEGEPEWYTGWTVDNTGVMTIEELPVLSLDITLENRSIPASDFEGRFQNHTYTAEEVRALPEEVKIVLEGPDYDTATEELCPTILEYRVMDADGDPVPDAYVEFYCSYNPNQGIDSKFLDDTWVVTGGTPNPMNDLDENWDGEKTLTAGGYTNAQGIYLYGFQSEVGTRDGFRYRARVRYNGKTTYSEEVELEGARTVYTLTAPE